MFITLGETIFYKYEHLSYTYHGPRELSPLRLDLCLRDLSLDPDDSVVLLLLYQL